MVHAGDSEAAYQAFAAGKTIFDISPDGSLLEQFGAENQAEFYGEIIVRGLGGKFRSMEIPGLGRVFLTYHKHKAQEVLVPELQEIEGSH